MANTSCTCEHIDASQIPSVQYCHCDNNDAWYLFEIATASLLPVHHVMEDGDHDVPQIRLGHQSHLQERTYHRWDEIQLVFPWRRDAWVRLRHRASVICLFQRH